MKYVLTADEIRNFEERTMSAGVPLSMLKMRAALAVADEIKELAGESGMRVAVFCGGGNNGADGLLTAIRLHSMGYDVTAYLVYPDSKGIAEELASAKLFNVPVALASEYGCDADIVVDAIFGFGLNRDVEGEAADIIQKLNGNDDAVRIAIDITSGLDHDIG